LDQNHAGNQARAGFLAQYQAEAQIWTEKQELCTALSEIERLRQVYFRLQGEANILQGAFIQTQSPISFHACCLAQQQALTAYKDMIQARCKALDLFTRINKIQCQALPNPPPAAWISQATVTVEPIGAVG